MSPTVSAFLNTPYELSNDQIAYFKENGFIKLKQVLSKEVIEYMDLSPRSHSPSSPVPDAIANNGALFPVSDDNAADPSHGLGPLPVPVGHHDGPLAGRQRAIAVVHSAMLIIQAETGSA